MNTEENQRKLEKIKRILDCCCMESICAARYTIEECDTERGLYLLLFIYNRQNKIIEARLSSYDDMQDIAIRIRRKCRNQLRQYANISKIIVNKYSASCCIEVMEHKSDKFRVDIYLNGYVTILKGDYNEIIEQLIKGIHNESK